MSQHPLIKNCESDMDKAIKALEGNLAKVRTGRASINMLDGVKVDYYGNMTLLNQVATLSTPDAKTILISPYEKQMIQGIEKSIMASNMGLQPMNDGNVVRIPIPPLTEERRKDLAKQIKKMSEDTKVSIRQVRQDFNNKIKNLEKNKEVSQDESKKMQGDTQKITDKFIAMADEKASKKEKEVLSI